MDTPTFNVSKKYKKKEENNWLFPATPLETLFLLSESTTGSLQRGNLDGLGLRDEKNL